MLGPWVEELPGPYRLSATQRNVTNAVRVENSDG
jgi:hypothetical protein